MQTLILHVFADESVVSRRHLRSDVAHDFLFRGLLRLLLELRPRRAGRRRPRAPSPSALLLLQSRTLVLDRSGLVEHAEVEALDVWQEEVELILRPQVRRLLERTDDLLEDAGVVDIGNGLLLARPRLHLGGEEPFEHRHDGIPLVKELVDLRVVSPLEG